MSDPILPALNCTFYRKMIFLSIQFTLRILNFIWNEWGISTGCKWISATFSSLFSRSFLPFHYFVTSFWAIFTSALSLTAKIFHKIKTVLVEIDDIILCVSFEFWCNLFQGFYLKWLKSINVEKKMEFSRYFWRRFFIWT